MSALVSSIRGGAATTANIAAYLLSGGRFVLLEGRRHATGSSNWLGHHRQVPLRYARPRTEEEIVALVRGAARLRVVGAGHSFNDGIVTEEVLVSLDDYTGLVAVDRARRQITVRAGTRIRDVVALLREHGLAFPALPSHDAQSIGGILATDVHGTGRDWGFVSDDVVDLTLVDGTGAVHLCRPEDPLFRAAVGGVGAVGIIIEVTLQAVPRFRVRQQTSVARLSEVRDRLPALVAEHDHLSLYLFPYADHCQVNTWDRTAEPLTRGGPARELASTAADALLASWAGNLLAYTGLLPLGRHWSRLSYLTKRGTRLVLDSPQAYNRTIYHVHQELEFTVGFAEAFEICDRLLALYDRLSVPGRRLPYLLIEVRFTPAGHDRTLVGPGRHRRCAWIDLICNDSEGCAEFYAAAIELIKQTDARPHLGKWVDGFTAADLTRLDGDDRAALHRLMREHDPQGRFVNPFVRRVLGDARVDPPAAA